MRDAGAIVVDVYRRNPDVAVAIKTVEAQARHFLPDARPVKVDGVQVGWIKPEFERVDRSFLAVRVQRRDARTKLTSSSVGWRFRAA